MTRASRTVLVAMLCIAVEIMLVAMADVFGLGVWMILGVLTLAMATVIVLVIKAVAEL